MPARRYLTGRPACTASPDPVRVRWETGDAPDLALARVRHPSVRSFPARRSARRAVSVWSSLPRTATSSLFFRSVPEGRGPAAVAANQRARLLDAMTRVVVRKGYARTTVADVVEVAGVSRRTFYEQFVDKEACFLAAYETCSTVVMNDMAEAVRAVPTAGWRARLHCALETYTQALSE